MASRKRTTQKPTRKAATKRSAAKKPAPRKAPAKKPAARKPAAMSSLRADLEALLGKLRPFRLFPDPSDAPREKELAAAEEDGELKFPRLLRELFARYGGVQLNGWELGFDDVYEALTDNPLLEESEWGKGYFQIVREPDGSRILLPRQDPPGDDVPVYRYGHDEGDEEPRQYATSLADWLNIELESAEPPEREEDDA